MTDPALIAALCIPADARVNRRVPKKLLLEQGAPTAADRRRIQDGIDEAYWVAALKPTNIGVPAFRDETREYLEIAVVAVALRQDAKPARLIELIHRAIPYPLVLALTHSGETTLSLAHKRRSLGETGQVVIETVHRSAPMPSHGQGPDGRAFLANLALSTLPTQHMFALYQGWIDRLTAWEAASVTGAFTLPDSAERAMALREGLDARARIQRDIAALRAMAERENQINRRAELNIEVKRLETELSAIEKRL